MRHQPARSSSASEEEEEGEEIVVMVAVVEGAVCRLDQRQKASLGCVED